MNICAVRTMKQPDVFDFQPHEPKSEQSRLALKDIVSYEGIPIPSGKFVIAAICKHCGSIYLTEE